MRAGNPDTKCTDTSEAIVGCIVGRQSMAPVGGRARVRRASRSCPRAAMREGAFDYVHGKTDAGPAARIPPWSVTARGVYETPFWTGTVEVHHVGKQDRVADFELPTSGYTTLDASLVLRPVEDKPDLKFFLDAHNLTNVEAREHASFLKDIAPLPGRTFRMGVGYRF